MLGEAGDDGIDEPSRPPPGLLDRCWVHPTELAAVIEGYGRPPRPWLPTAGSVFVAGTLVALVVAAALSVAAAIDSVDSPTTVHTATRGVGFGPATATLLGNDEPAGLVAVSASGGQRSQEGTAVCVSAGGAVVTALGLVTDASRVDVTGPDGSPLRARVTTDDPGAGLVLLDAGIPLEPARLGRSSGLHVGDRVLVAAAHREGVTSDLRATVTAIPGPDPGRGAGRIVVTVAAGRPAPGSALLDSAGAVVGILVGADADGRTYAVPIETAMALRD